MNVNIVCITVLLSRISFCMKSNESLSTESTTFILEEEDITNITMISLEEETSTPAGEESSTASAHVPCSCGVYLSGQFEKGKQPEGDPILSHLHDNVKFPCTKLGTKLCTNKCLDMIVKHLPTSGRIICNAVNYDIFRKKAYLFIKNCTPRWVFTNLSAGKDYCCKGGKHVKCSSMKPAKST